MRSLTYQDIRQYLEIETVHPLGKSVLKAVSSFSNTTASFVLEYNYNAVLLNECQISNNMFENPVIGLSLYIRCVF